MGANGYCGRRKIIVSSGRRNLKFRTEAYGALAVISEMRPLIPYGDGIIQWGNHIADRLAEEMYALQPDDPAAAFQCGGNWRLGAAART